MGTGKAHTTYFVIKHLTINSLRKNFIKMEKLETYRDTGSLADR